MFNMTTDPMATTSTLTTTAFHGADAQHDHMGEVLSGDKGLYFRRSHDVQPVPKSSGICIVRLVVIPAESVYLLPVICSTTIDFSDKVFALPNPKFFLGAYLNQVTAVAGLHSKSVLR